MPERFVARRHHWTHLSARAAALWSLIYGLLGLHWALGGAGFPFGRGNDPAAQLSLLADVRVGPASVTIVVLGLMGALVGAVIPRLTSRGLARTALLAFATGAAILLLLAIPDFRVLALIGYAPILLIGPLFGWSVTSSVSDALSWPLLNQLLCVTGGLLWMGAAVGAARAGLRDGDRSARTGWRAPAAAARWGRWAVGIAVVIPAFYAMTRWAWAFGFPLGVSDPALRATTQTPSMIGAAFGLGSVALAGAVLTLGLVRPWGERFPRWLPFIGGRLVPMSLVVIPASVVSVLVIAAGLRFVRLTLAGAFPLGSDWAIAGPGLLWPVWGAALGAATLAYYYRRGETTTRDASSGFDAECA